MTAVAWRLLERDSAAAIVEDMLGRVRSTWHSVARSHGVSERDCALIAGAFAYPGFEAPDLQHAGREIEAKHRRKRRSERER